MNNFNLYEVFPFLNDVLLFSGLCYLMSLILTKRLEYSVKSEYDAKLMELQAEFRRAERQLDSKIQERQSEINSLRSGVLNAVANRHDILLKRQIEAIDQLWIAYKKILPVKMQSRLIGVLKIDELKKSLPTNQRAKAYVEGIANAIDKVDFQDGENFSPYVSPRLLYLYSTFRAVCAVVAGKAYWLNTPGLDKEIVSSEAADAALIEILPEYEERLKAHSFYFYPDCMDELEKLILDEMRIMLNGKSIAKDHLAFANELIELSRKGEEQKMREAIPAEFIRG